MLQKGSLVPPIQLVGAQGKKQPAKKIGTCRLQVGSCAFWQELRDESINEASQ